MHLALKHPRIAAAALFALAGAALPAVAADYYVVVPTPGRTEAPPEQNISVTLNPYTLPAGVVGQVYKGFDLNAVLQVTGDDAFDAGQVGWGLEGSTLPGGLALNASGAIAGTPTAATDAAGLLFSVLATYKGVQGSQDYRIAVGAPSAPPGHQAFTTPGSYTFTVPVGVTSISAVAIGGGGGAYVFVNGSYSYSGSGGGGALAYQNFISVIPGETLAVVVGAGGAGSASGAAAGDSGVSRGGTWLVRAGGAQKHSGSSAGNGGLVKVGQGGNGGGGAAASNTSDYRYGGGGAGGYLGNGGGASAAAAAGSGGGGGGGRGGSTSYSGAGGGGGGGVGLFGLGETGAAGIANSAGGFGGGGGSGAGAGSRGTTTAAGGASLFGGGRGAGPSGGAGARGAVRIIWGEGRSFPHNAN